MASALRVLHAIHDFLPRHQAGSEIYALELCRAQSARHHVTVLCADYDPSRAHGHVAWRVHEGIPVVDVANNWVCRSFADSYRSPMMRDRIGQVLDAVQPDVIHLHSLLNLSFDVPAIANARGIPMVATLHDYTLVCASGGQRIHRAEQHVCRDIDPDRCARCFRESPFHPQMSFGRVTAAAKMPARMRTLAMRAARRVPALANRFARASQRAMLPIGPQDIVDRLVSAQDVFNRVDLFIAPSPSIAAEFRRLGLEAAKIRVSDYGFVPLACAPRARRSPGPLRIGYVGTLVWHKGVHVLVDAIRRLPAKSCELKIFGDEAVFADYSKQLRERAAGLPVSFMGAFSRDRVADVYASIDVLVVPSLWLENSPLVMHEAFMAGVPVVGARMGGIADLIEDGENGFLYDANSPAALAAALQHLIDAPDRVAAFAGRAPRVKSIAEDARECEDAYAEVLGRALVGAAP